MAGTGGAALAQDCGGLAGGHVPPVAPNTRGQAARQGAASFVPSLCALCDRSKSRKESRG